MEFFEEESVDPKANRLRFNAKRLADRSIGFAMGDCEEGCGPLDHTDISSETGLIVGLGKIFFELGRHGNSQIWHRASSS
jgi:hypothetical protein